MSPQVFGESAQAIMTAMTKSKRRVTATGMHQFELSLPKDEADPLFRATMRAEAELLLSDADEPECLWRTPEQRRADAMFETIMAASAALKT